MPTRPKRACLTAGCTGYAARFGRCAEHAAPIVAAMERRDRSGEPGRRFYFTTRWKKLRAAVLRREPLCRACEQAGRTTAATDIDHVVRHRGNPALFWSVDNLQPLCGPCHVTKTLVERGHGRVWAG